MQRVRKKEDTKESKEIERGNREKELEKRQRREVRRR